MKKIILTLSAVLLVLLAVSCNMDSTTGLFQEAGTSVKKESYLIRKVIDEDVTNSVFLVAADEGIFVYSAKSGKIGETAFDGTTSKYVIWGSLTETSGSYSWECIFYSEEDGKYYTINQNGEKNEYAGIDTKFVPVGDSCYDNDTTIIVFKNTETSTNWIFAESTIPVTSKIVDTGCTNVSFIGEEYFIGYNSSGTHGYFKYSSSSVNSFTENNTYITYEGHVFLTNSGTFINETGGTQIGSVSSNYTYTRTHAITDINGNVYFILKGLNNVYKITGNTLDPKNCASLSSIEVIYIDSVSDDGNYMNVITAESGAKCINIKDSKIDSWKESY